MTTTTTQITTTDNGSKLLTQDQALAMAKMAAEAAIKDAKAHPSPKTPQEMMAAAIDNRIKNNLASRIVRDLDSDASVRTGMRTVMNNSLQASGAFAALGMQAESNEMSVQGEVARLAIRKGLRAEGALGHMRAALSYVPVVGDGLLGGASLQAKALYAQQNNAHAAAQTAEKINAILGPVAANVGRFMEAGAEAHTASVRQAEAQIQLAQARTQEAHASAAFNNARRAKEKADVQGIVRKIADALADAKAELDSATAAVTAASSALHTGRANRLPKADITALETELAKAEKLMGEANRKHMLATVEHGEAVAMLLAYG